MPSALRLSDALSSCRLLALTLAVGLLAGCATAPRPGTDGANVAGTETGANDPLEGVNRVTYEVNSAADRVVIRPVAEIYNHVLPQEARDGVRDFLRNLRSPIIAANQLLQGDLDAAGDTVGRFVVNTTVGFGGVFDVAGHSGIAQFQDEDFGQTLGVHGVGEGPYLVLPILGPSNLRDTAGLVVDTVADPVNIALRNTDNDGWLYARAGVTGIDARSRLIGFTDDLEKNSVDPYARLRDLYHQRRENEIANRDSGYADAAPEIPDADPNYR